MLRVVIRNCYLEGYPYKPLLTPFLYKVKLLVRLCRYGLPGASLLGFLNSAVHVVMYSYYALAALGPRVQKHLWWKRYITMIQLVQFVILCAYECILYFYKQDYPSIVFWIISSIVLIFY